MGTDDCDRLLELFKEKMKEDGKVVRVPNEEKIALVRRLHQIVSNIVTGADVKLRLHEPFNNMGVIEIEGKKVLIEDTGLFAQLATCADNFNAYSRVDGRVHMDFTFYGVTVPVEV